jgi:hypothetical protein
MKNVLRAERMNCDILLGIEGEISPEYQVMGH